MLLTLNSFSGIMPRVNEQQLPVGAAVEASGFRTDSECIEPYKGAGLPVTTIAGCRTFAVYPTSEDRTWPPGSDDAYLCWDKDVDYCPGISIIPGVGGGHESILFTGDGSPKQANPLNFAEPWIFPLGIGKPSPPPVIQKTFFDESLTPIEKGLYKSTLTSVSYCYTISDNFNQESQPSDPTDFIDVFDYMGGEGIRLSGFGIPSGGVPGGVDDTFGVNIYRCQAGSGSEADFFFIGETSINISDPSAAFFNDYSVDTKSFREAAVDVLATTDWTEPPYDLSGLVRMSGSVLAGFIKDTNELCFSEPLVQYAWPEKYRLKMPQSILHIVCLGEELVVFMASMISVVRGEPGLMTISEVYGGKGTPCLTRRGFVKMESGVLFPGHDGLYLYNGSSCSNITASSMNTLQWRSLLPDKFMAVYYDGRYWAFREASEKAITIDIANGSVIEIALGGLYPVSGLHVDYHGRFFILSADKAYPWSEGTDSIEAVWKSGILTFSSPVNLAAAIITSDSPTTENAIQLEIWSHYRGIKTLVFDSVEAGITVPLNRPFRLPGGFMSASVQVRIKTSVTVRDMRFATSMSELGG